LEGVRKRRVQLVSQALGDPSTKPTNPRIKLNPLDPALLDYNSQQNRSPSDFDLSMVVGHNGLALLLNLMGRKKFADMKEFIKVLRRLHLPYYEEARLYWNDALRDGFHDGCCFDENTLLDIIKNYGEDR